VEDCPLALCDFRTVDPEDLVPMDIVYPHFVDEAYEVKYNPAHRWFYKKGMTQEDVIVFKLYDSLRSEATGESPYHRYHGYLTYNSSVPPFGVCRPFGTAGHAAASQHRSQGDFARVKCYHLNLRSTGALFLGIPLRQSLQHWAWSIFGDLSILLNIDPQAASSFTIPVD
jgi:hypothetical protein